MGESTTDILQQKKGRWWAWPTTRLIPWKTGKQKGRTSKGDLEVTTSVVKVQPEESRALKSKERQELQGVGHGERELRLYNHSKDTTALENSNHFKPQREKVQGGDRSRTRLPWLRARRRVRTWHQHEGPPSFQELVGNSLRFPSLWNSETLESDPVIAKQCVSWGCLVTSHPSKWIFYNQKCLCLKNQAVTGSILFDFLRTFLSSPCKNFTHDKEQWFKSYVSSSWK